MNRQFFGLFFPLFACCLPFFLSAQCPQLNSNATLTSPDCTSGTTPCDVCLGDVITLTASGSGLQPGSCVNWYYGTTNNFNPYTGGGTLLGCSMIQATTPLPCNSCPITLGLFVDACGTEENNEFIALYSGSGFFVNDLSVNFDAMANNGNPNNADIGAGCGWQEPAATIVSGIQTICPGVTVVGAGPGEAVPPGVPVLIFTSAGFDASYNYSSLCPLSTTIYVMQNACVRTADAFANAGPSKMTIVSQTCGCADTTIYNPGFLMGGNGAYATDANLPIPFYGNSGCGFPPFPGLPSNPPPAITVVPLDVTVSAAMCSGGPFYVVGIVEPLPGGCAETFTNYLQYNVSCPEAMFEPVTVQCPGESVDLVISFMGQAPWSFDLYQGAVLLGSFSTSDNPLVIPISPNVSTSFSIQNLHDAVCAGPDAGISIVVPPAPTATMTLNTPTSACSGDIAEFQVNIAGGTAPYTVVVTVNGVVQAPVVTSSNPVDFNISIDSTTTVVLQSVDANGCQASVSGSFTVTVVTPLSAVISGGGQICQGGAGADITVTFTGSGPYTFTYTADNVLQMPVTTNSNPYVFNESPSSGTIYQLVSVSNATCTGAVSGVAIIFVFTPSTAFLSGDKTLCNFADTTVMVDFTGTGPFELVYAIDNIVQPEVVTFDDPLFLPVNSAVNTVYTLISVHSPGCTGSVSGSATITVNYPPAYANLDINCNPANNDYTIEFDVTGATLPLTLLTGSGTFTGTHFISNPLPQAQNYQYVFHDANDCGDITVAGPSFCNCISDAGAMDLADTLSACTGSVITAVYNGSPVLDSDDSLRFILHTTAALPVGQILDWSPTPSFGFLPGMNTGTLYYISAVAGDYAGNDSIDLADPCLSLSVGTAIIFYTPPSAQLGPDQVICSGDPVSLPITFSGAAPFSLNYAINGAGQPPITGIMSNPYLLNPNLPGTSTVTLINVTDQHCTGVSADTALVTVNFTPQIVNVVDNCDLFTSSYTIEFDVQGGVAPYTIAGSGGTLTGTHFVSDPIASGLQYNFSLSDVNGCGFSMISDTVICACATNAGATSPALIALCPGGIANVAQTVAPVLDGNDVLSYYLHTSAGTTLGTVISISPTPTFGFLAGPMQTGTVYYISAVAGNPISGDTINLNDPCHSIAAGTPVVWNVAPTAALSGTFDICPGQSQALNITFTGQSPYNFTYTKNGVLSSATAFSNSFALNTNLIQNTTFVLVSVQDVNCTGTVSGQAVITVHPVPVIANPVLTCNPDNLHFNVEFDVQNADLPSVSVSGPLSGTYTPATGHFASIAGNLPNSYQFIVQDQWNCGQDTLLAVPNCSCATDAGQINQLPMDICFGSDIAFALATGQNLDPNDVLQYVLCSDPANLPASILARSAQPLFSFIPALQSGQTYYIVGVAGNTLANGDVNFADPCVSITAPVPVTIRALPTATIGGDTTVCIGSNYVFPVLFTGQAPFKFSYTINNGPQQPTITAPQNSFSISTNNVQQTQVFNLVFVDDKYCTGTVSGVVTVDVRPNPVITLSGDDRLCPGESATLHLTLQNASSCNFSVSGTPTGGTQNFTGAADGFTFTVTPAQSTLYTLQNVVVSDNNCSAQAGGSAQIDLAPMNITATASNYNGFGISCYGAMDGAAGAVVSGGFSPVSLDWSTSDTLYNITDLPPGNYTVTATDAEGCTAVTSVSLQEPLPLTADWYTTSLDCRPGSSGSVTITDLADGVGPYQIQVNNMPAMAAGSLPVKVSGLVAGPVDVVFIDANGCTLTESDTIYQPIFMNLTLTPDQQIFPGDSALLIGVASGNSVTSIVWNPSASLNTPNQLSTYAKPEQTTIYSLTVQDSSGCTASGTVTVFVLNVKRVFVPNVLKPGAADDNDIFTVYGGPEVVRVNYMLVFDRWGDLVFENKDFLPNFISAGWNGQWRGKEVPPGVYTFVLEVEYRDGITEVFSGDLTVVR